MTVNPITLKRSAQVYRAINHDLRRKIFEYLVKNGKTTVTEIYRHFKLEQSVASQHLAILRLQNFVVTEREARFIYYKANTERLQQVNDLSQQLLNGVR
jgi:DNA-binding transcriptional ArsR family regulator